MNKPNTNTKKKRGGRRPGGGRKPALPGHEPVAVGTCLPAFLVRQIDSAAKKRGITRSALVKLILEEYTGF